MIRINLLHQTAGLKGLWIPKWSKAETVCFLLCLSLASALGGWSLELLERRSDLSSQRAVLVQQIKELAPIQQEIEQAIEDREELRQRIETVERLRLQQLQPATMMNRIMATVPNAPGLWLTRLSQNHLGITLEGQAFDVDSVSALVGSLEGKSPFGQVQLAHWKEQENLIHFQLECELAE